MIAQPIIQLFFIMTSVISLVISPQLYAVDGNTIPLKCISIPQHHDQLCTITTVSPLGPYDDVAFYRKSPKNEFYLLGVRQGGVATFSGIGLSEKGTFLWIGWAEEGHPYFSFYETAVLLREGLLTPELALLNDDAFIDFVLFSDEGQVTYTQQPGITKSCTGNDCKITIDLIKESHDSD